MIFSSHLAAADRAIQKHLGGAVTYTPSRGATVPVTGIFDAAYVRADVGQAGVSTTGPAVFLVLADLPTNPEEEDLELLRITVDAVKYRVREAQPDGMGGVLLHLYRA